MRRIFGMLLLTIGALGLRAQHANINRGFEADKVYQFGQVDNVNLYNGNLSLTIPLGSEYSGNGTLRYRFALTYNSKNWDYEVKNFNCPASYHTLCQKDYKKAIPSRRSNAGMGWLLSLGRMVLAGDVAADPWDPACAYAYESPDGADHCFVPESTTSNVHHTNDGSFLKLVVNSGTPETFIVYFPDGTSHIYVRQEQPYLSTMLWQIRDPFGNRLEIDYTTPTFWTLSEYEAGSTVALRSHYVTVKDISNDPLLKPLNAPANYNFVVEKVDLAAFDDPSVTGDGRAVYTFEYATETIEYGCDGDNRNYGPYIDTPDPKVPRLSRIIRPDATTWEMDYYSTRTPTSHCAAIKQLTFPTKGTIDWTFGTYIMPTHGCNDLPSETSPEAPYAYSEGMTTRTVTDPVRGTSGTWTYTQTYDDPGPNGEFFTCWPDSTLPKSRWTKTTVLRPDANKSEHYFSLVPWNHVLQGEYSLPYTRSESSVAGQACDTPDKLCLSSVDYDCSSGSCVKKRSRYVRYEGDGRPSFWDEIGPLSYGYRREVESRTVFHVDQPIGDHFITTERKEYDGLGHFRLVRTTGSWSTLAREERTNYNPGKPSVTVDPVTWANTPSNNHPTQGWFLSLFDTTTVSDGNTTLKSEFDFDPENGLLRRRRDLASLDETRGTHDTIATYDRNTLGNLTLESYYGGDGQSIANWTLSDLTLPAAPEYRIQHGYSHGARSSSAYLSASGTEVLRFLDTTIDQNTGLVKTSQDPSGVPTTFAFNAMGQLKSVAPTGTASTTYTYSTSATPHAVDAETAAAAGSVESRYEFDGFGRVIRTKTLLPAAAGSTPTQWSTVDVHYDALGRKQKVSEPYIAEPGVTPVYTEFSYDALDRVTKGTAPDSSVTETVYRGARERDRINKVETSAGVTTVTVTERYDPFGRLVEVGEPSGPAGETVTNAYTYDPGDRLTNVEMAGVEGTQAREFVYDGLGRLREEQHPESSRVYYHDYDSRGHALSKSLEKPVAGGDSSPTPHDLRFTVDKAERPLSVKVQHPGSETRSLLVLKEFSYGEENGTVAGATNYTKGKLESVARYNYDPDPDLAEDDVYIVTELYDYVDDAGRKTDRTTVIDRLDYGSLSRVREIKQHVDYNDLGLTERLNYPSCLYCTYPATKALLSTYSAGRLQELDRIDDANVTRDVAKIGYFQNGMINTVLHGNTVQDTIDLDDQKMPRPKRIKFEPWKECIAPATVTISVSPSSTITVGQTATLTAVVSPSTTTTPITYEWSVIDENGSWTTIGTNSQTLTVTPAGTTSYAVRATNACHMADSNTVTAEGPLDAEAMATITVSDCEPPAIETGPPAMLEVQSGTSVTLDVAAYGTQPLSYAWHVVGNPSVVIGTGRSLTVSSVTQTTSYACRITNSCGEVTTGTSTVKVPLPAPTGLTAARSDAQSITLTWNAASGANQYKVERMSLGGTFGQIGSTSQTSYVDTPLTSGVTYVYRVIAANSTNGSSSAPSNRDLATMMSFTNVAPGTAIDDAYFHELLTALNALHGANGWPAATWTSILPPDVSPPGAGIAIRGTHLAVLRDRMNLARQALGVAAGPYADDPIGPGVTLIRASQVTAVQQRAQ